MVIRSLMIASAFAVALIPQVASADRGYIRFVGAIAEPAGCQARLTPTGPQSRPQGVCVPTAGSKMQDMSRRVVVSTRALVPQGQSQAAATPRRYVVTFEYL